jgi:hypothetical protein
MAKSSFPKRWKCAFAEMTRNTRIFPPSVTSIYYAIDIFGLHQNSAK